MATVINFSETLNISSEEAFEFECTPCVKNRKTKEALHFCVECQEYLCAKCTAWHNSFSQMAGHNLLKAEIASRNTTAFSYIPTERCSTHPSKIIEMYCSTHDQVACTVCTAINHKACVDVRYIPDVISTLFTQKHNTYAIKELTDVSEQLGSLKEILNKAVNDIDTAKLTTLQAIQIFKADVNHILDKLVTTIERELDQKCQTLRLQWQSQIQLVHATTQDIQKRLEQLKNNYHNNSQQFVLVKMNKDSISIAETMISQLQPFSIQFTFSENLAMKGFLKKLPSFGNLSQNIEMRRLSLYKIKKACNINIKLSNTKFYHEKWGLCILDSGDLLLGDCENNNVRLIDISKFKETSQCKLPASPRAVCMVTNGEAAVALGNKSIQLVSIRTKLVRTRIIQLDHECYGLSIDGETMYITDAGTNLYVHTLNGSLLMTINKDNFGRNIFSCACHVVVNNGKINVADSKNGLLILDTGGQLVCKYSGTELFGARGVCTDGKGNIFVCGQDSNNVLQINLDGHRLGELLSKSNGLDKPALVKFDKIHSRLFVASYDKYEIQIFTLQ